MHPFIIRPLARNDIDDAYAWYELQTPGRGDFFLDELYAQIAEIIQTPERFGRVSREVRAAPLPRSKFNIYYMVELSHISILAVQHASANPRKWKQRK